MLLANLRSIKATFGFLLSMMEALSFGGEELAEPGLRGRGRRPARLKPIAPFDSDHRKAIAAAFDRDSGKPVPASALKSYAAALAQYHLQPESKFLNADFADRGVTQRRHVRMIATRHIGKESHDWERQAILGLNLETQPDYGLNAVEPERAFAELTALIAKVGQQKVARALGVSSAQLPQISAHTFPQHVISRLPSAVQLFNQLNSERNAKMHQLREAVDQDGLRATARRIGVDPSNLRRALHRVRSGFE